MLCFCAVCQTFFEAKFSRVKYCSKKCKEQQYFKNRPEYENSRYKTDTKFRNKKKKLALKYYRKNKDNLQFRDKRNQLFKDWYKKNKTLHHKRVVRYLKKIYEKNRENSIFVEKNKVRLYTHRRLAKNKKFCKICNSDENLEIHHKKYVKDVKECEILCRNCHRKLHKKLNTIKVFLPL